ncbi:MAG TPA: hypothetical protein VM686_29145 [Polyangiaceae bacterium]|nr:hypothetical protein [Polyangiaceae bacterium]
MSTLAKNIARLLPLAVVPALLAAASPAQADPVSDAYAFIKNQRRPLTVKRQIKGYPVQSYQAPSGDPLYDKCFTYDQAVAVMALVANPSPTAPGPTQERLDYAKGILDAMAAVQVSDGSWNTVYACSTGAVALEWKREVGPTAWVAMAIKKYQQARNDFSLYETNFKNAVNWISKLQNMQSTSMANTADCNSFSTRTFNDGGVQHGQCKSGASYKVEGWAGTEINQEAFILFKKYGERYPTETLPLGVAGGLTGTARANLMWSTSNTGFLAVDVFAPGQARFLTGRNDVTHHTDVNPLGVMTRIGSGRSFPAGLTDADLLASTVSDHVTTETGTVNGVSQTITGCDYEGDDMGTAGLDDVWFEGVGQMTLAFYLSGDAMNGDFYRTASEQGQWGGGACNGASNCGGIQYSLKGTNNGYWTMTTAPAISPTGFYLMALDAAYHPGNPFNPYGL